MNYESTVTYMSAACPGVSYTIRRFTRGLRDQLRRQLAPIQVKQRELAQRRGEWLEAVANRLGIETTALMTDSLNRDESRKLADLLEEDDVLQKTEADPIIFDAGFVKIVGLKIDGLEPANSIAVRVSGPPDLTEEILAAVKAEIGLTPAQVENLELPTTSAAAAGGQTSDTSADPASEKDSTNPATAGDTSLTK